MVFSLNLVFIIIFTCLNQNVIGQVIVRLISTEYVTYRPGTINVKVKKEGYSNNAIDVLVQILDPFPSGRSVFVGSSQSVQFEPEGPIFVEKSSIFTIYDDGSPEPDRNYTLTLKTSTDGVTVASPSIAKITVVGSNDPLGIFGFHHNGSKVVQYEKFIGKDFLDVSITRSKGFYGLVYVNVQVLECSPDSLEIIPRNNQVLFKNFVTEQNVHFKMPDELPGTNVSCIIKITGATTPDPSFNVTLNFPRVDPNSDVVVIIIQPGDAFVRFSKTSYYARIDKLISTIQLTVFRGIHSKNDSLVVGSVRLPATVRYYVLSQTARYGVDFKADNSSIGFGPGISSVSLPVSILPGNSPEKTKYFQIVLQETTGNIVLSEPHIANITLTREDEIHGILSWKAVEISSNSSSDVGFQRFLTEFSSDIVNNVRVWSVRGGGSLGFISIQWKLVADRSKSATGSDDSTGLGPTLGLLVVGDGETSASLNFTVVKGFTSEPRPLRFYELRMLPETITGGAKVMLNESIFYLLDRDCGIAYGMFVLNETSLHFRVDLFRTLAFGIFRSRGLYEDVLVDFEILHSEQGLVYNGTAFIPDGKAEVQVIIPVKNDMFITGSSLFYILISKPRLYKELLLGPYNSPILGNASFVNLSVPVEAANGIIRFNYSRLVVQLEPNSLHKLIQIPLSRDGSFGNVTVFWRLSGLEGIAAWNVSVVASDGYRDNFTGMSYVRTGQTQFFIQVFIEKYNLTSFSEMFDIEIIDWIPKSMAILEEFGSKCSIVLPELGNLAGFFQFCPSMSDSYVISAEKESVEICILRSGDFLVDASVLVYLEPNGDAKFYGGRTVVYFSRTDMTKKITIMAKNDGVPQLNVTYMLKLSSYGSRAAVTDATRNITITVLPHSYPFGIVEFSTNLIETIVLRNNQTQYAANLRVTRFKGGFSRASVTWIMKTPVEPNEKIFFPSYRGVITFELQQPDSFIGINFTAFNVPRFNKSFVIRLTNSTEGSILGENLEAIIRIVGFDYSIQFNDSLVHLASPGTYEVAIVRDGPLSSQSGVRCRTSPFTALDGRDYQGIYNESFVFSRGISSRHLNITILDDPSPRPDRTFSVFFYEVEGGIVAVNNLTVVVLAKHNSNGIFKFAPTFNKTSPKGSTVSFQVLREKGFYGNASVFYEIYSSDCNSSINNNSYFSSISGRVVFKDQQSLVDLSLVVQQNELPELEVYFCIQLIGVSGGPAYDPAMLGSSDLQVFLRLPPSNYPFGKIYFESSSSRSVSIAEDVNDNSGSTSFVSNKAKLVVLRSNGAVDYKRDPFLDEIVSWEVYSYQITSALTFPDVVDFSLLVMKAMGSSNGVPSGISVAPVQRRNGTGTTVFRFDGCEGCFVSVMTNKNISSEPSLAFSISVWIKSFSKDDPLSGCILSKSLNKITEYAVCLRSTERAIANVSFYYSTKVQQSMLLAIGLGKSISDETWHFLVIQFFDNSLVVHLDNVLIQQNHLPDLKLTSNSGEYIVGGMTPNQNSFYGYMQDLKLYGQKLNDLLLRELYSLPARKDVDMVSGYLIFNDSSPYRTIVLKSLDNSIPEPNKVFTIRLLDCSGPSAVSIEENISILTILKSDNANGLFGLFESCSDFIQDLGASSVACPLLRQRGTFGSVVLAWKVESIDAANENESYSTQSTFLETSGLVTFDPGIVQKNITLSLIDDWLPKLKQTFQVTLTSAMSSDGLVGSTATSGASMSPSSSSSIIQIRERNFPYGFFQLSTPKENGTSTRAMPGPLSITTDENVKILTLYIIRRQGLIGDASVEWKTLQGSAKSRESGPDYDFDSGAGLLLFKPGEIRKEINISIYPPETIRPDREFKIQVNNSLPPIGSGCGPETRVIISASRKAFGVFGFDRNSLEVFVSKDNAKVNESAVARFEIRREMGFLGFVTLNWDISCPLPSFTNFGSTGNVTFSPNQSTSYLFFNVTNDGIPSLKLTCFVKISTATIMGQGIIDDSRSNASMVLLPSNDPYGLFIVDPSNRFIKIESSDQNVTVAIERMFGTYGNVKVMHSTLTPDEFYPYLPGVGRASRDDFYPFLGEVQFFEGQQKGFFNVSIKRNLMPSLDVSIFARLTGVSLMGQEDIGPVPSSPRLGTFAECLAQIEIKSHDYPHGVLQLSTREVKVPQNFSSALGFVDRSAGSIGQVSVKIEIVSDSARAGINFVASSDFVVFGNGEKRRPLPLSVVNTLTPQPQLKFSVRLLNDSVVGGAVVGDPREMEVIIQRSWDLAGVFGFDESSSTLVESDLSSVLRCRLSVMRSGGSQGVVSVFWTTDSSVSTRLSTPPTGQIFFLSSETMNLINLEFLPRTIDDPVKEVVVRLVNASNDGHLDTSKSMHVIRVVPATNPYGQVLFGSSSFLLERTAPENKIPIMRVNGTQGSLRVFYSLRAITFDSIAKSQNGSLLAYFGKPLTGTISNTSSSTFIDTLKMPSAEACAGKCLYNSSCVAFSYDDANLDCLLSTNSTLNIANSSSTCFVFMKNVSYIDDIANTLAKENEDFEVQTNASFIFPGGITKHLLSIKIFQTDIPKLEQKFSIALLWLELADGDVGNPNFSPSIGWRSSCELRINSSNDPRGVFVIYHWTRTAMNSNASSDRSRYVEVEQRPDYSILLTVDRQAGLLGTVSVEWFVDSSRSTAVNGVQFSASGATLTFLPGVKIQTISIGMLKYDFPSDDKSIVVGLRNPKGGARVSNGNESSITIIIVAHDFVAGVISFRDEAAVGEEGNVVMVGLVRSSPGLGTVTVWWNIKPQYSNQTDAGLRFHYVEGFVIFQPGELSKVFLLNVTLVQRPEIDDTYIVQLRNITTSGIRQSGEALIDTKKGMFLVTIKGGNNPHGLFSFSESSWKVVLEASNTTIQLEVIRTYGTIGDVWIGYSISSAFIPVNDESTIPAITNVTFVEVPNGFTTCYQGSNVTNVSVVLMDDGRSRPNEVINVTLTSVKLISMTSPYNPNLAVGASAQVIILEREGAYGVAMFRPEFVRMTVSSLIGNLTVEVFRDCGLYRRVSVFCYAQPLPGTAGALPGVDYKFNSGVLNFERGLDRTFVTIEILSSDLPKAEKSLQLVLSNPTNGLVLGMNYRATVIILANGQMAGSIAFQTVANVTMKPSSLPYLTSVFLPLFRGLGTSGVINVPYIVTFLGGEGTMRIQPSSGVVTFRDKQSIGWLSLRVLPEVIETSDETYAIDLLPPDGGAVLSSPSRKFVRVFRKGSPFGLVQVYFLESNLRQKSFQLSKKRIELNLIRTIGTRSKVSVDISMASMVQTKRNSTLERKFGLTFFQNVSGAGPFWKWYLYDAYGSTYVLSFNGSNQIYLYRWQGSFVFIQRLDSEYPVAAHHANISGKIYLFIVSGRLSDVTPAKSKLYEVLAVGMLMLVQEIPTMAAKDALIFSSPSSSSSSPPPVTFLLVLSHQDVDGRTTTVSKIYMWNEDVSRFSTLSQNIATRGAQCAAAFKSELDNDGSTTEGGGGGEQVHIVVTNQFDSDYNTFDVESIVYLLNTDGQLVVQQKIRLMNADALVIFDDLIVSPSSSSPPPTYPTSSSKSNVFATFLHDFNRSVSLYSWEPKSAQFIFFQKISFDDDVVLIDVLVHPQTYEKLLMVAGRSMSGIYKLEKSNAENIPIKFSRIWSYNQWLLPLTIPQSSTILTFVVSPPEEEYPVPIYLLAFCDEDAVLYPNVLTVSFEEGQASQITFLSIVGGQARDQKLSFNVSLLNPKFGVEIGNNSTLEVDTDPNASTDGVFQFAEDSVSKDTVRYQDRSSSCSLNVKRTEGMRGSYALWWKVKAIDDVKAMFVANTGRIEFQDRETKTSFDLILSSGPELYFDIYLEVLLYDLVPLVQKSPTVNPNVNSYSLPARLGDNITSYITIKAKEAVYGVFEWEFGNYSVSEAQLGKSSIVSLSIVRRQGALGRVKVLYVTSEDPSVPQSSRARAWSDFVPVNSSVTFENGMRRILVNVTVLKNSEPELERQFLVRLFGLELLPDVSGSQPSGKLGPTLDPRSASLVAFILIGEHGSPRGIVQFRVQRNEEGRIDVYEGDLVQMLVTRSSSFLGMLEVEWISHFVTSLSSESSSSSSSSSSPSLSDLILPQTGVLHFLEGQREAYISLKTMKVDGDFSLRVVDVILANTRPSSGALGDDTACRIGIRSTLSSSSLVSILPERAELKRSRYPNDTDGRVTLNVVRIGISKDAYVQWRLDLIARSKFLPPHYGEIAFKVGEAVQQLKLQSTMSTDGRGEEVVNLSLVGVSEGSMVSPSSRSCSLVLLPDAYVVGYLSINAASKSIMTSKPSVGEGDGRLEIRMMRIGGFCGELKATWKITPSNDKNGGIFFRDSGEILLPDLEVTSVVDLLVLESLEPNLLMEFMFQVTSIVSSRVDTSVIILLPSNYPCGWFSFEMPSVLSINRSLQSRVSMSISRKFGISGGVKVFYDIIDVNATSLYEASTTTNWLLFEDGARSKSLDIRLRKEDSLPRGPSVFLVNLTRVELTFVNPNEGLVSVNVLATIGSPRLFTVLIEPDPEAGGIIQFNGTRVSVYRDFGMVSLPISRGPGTYGDVRVHYTATGISARQGDDFYPDEGWVMVRDGSDGGSINISLVDDGRIKPASLFLIRIVQVSDPLATLGSKVECLVKIEKSGYPYGKFGFVGASSISLPNLDIASSVIFTIQRTISFQLDQRVTWRISDPSTGLPLVDTSDLTLTGVEVEGTSSSLDWRDGEGGRKSFTLLLKPRSAWELEKKFAVGIVGVESQGGGEDRSGDVDPLHSEVVLIMEKFGNLNGLLRFETTTRNFFDEPPIGQMTIQYVILRSLGTYGDIEISWTLTGSKGAAWKDFGSTSGLVIMREGQSRAFVELSLLYDNEDEFDETFVLAMVKSSGGADIDRNFSSVSFVIRGHGYPCGLFSLVPALQRFIVSPDPPLQSRKILLNVTRTRGLSSTVMMRMNLTYDQAENSLLYTNSKEFTILMANQSSWMSTEIDILKDVFISSRSYFTACIISLTVLDGNGLENIQPSADPSMQCSKIPISREAGNSEIGFLMQSAPINYENCTSRLAVQRYGSFGPVQIDWSIQKGAPPSQFDSFILSDLVSPSSGSVSMIHGQSLAYLEVKLSSVPSRRELFVLALQTFSSDGPARFLPRDNLTCLIQPDGVVGISSNQLDLSVTRENNVDPSVTLNLERSFGSLTDIEVWYSAYSSSISSMERPNHKDVQYGKVLLSSGQIAATLMVKMNPYLSSSDYFFVNLTVIKRLNGNSYEGSLPLLAPNRSRSKISLKNAFTANGVFSIKQMTDQPVDWFNAESVPFIVSRTGSTLGGAFVNARSVGGGEPWDATFGKFPSPDNDTIAALLSKRDYRKRSYVRMDYAMLDVSVEFKEGEKEHLVDLSGLNFNGEEEVDKEIFVYLRSLTDGLRIARPSIDNRLEGYSVVKIQFDSRWKEVIGFVLNNNNGLIGNEDAGILDLLMTIDRTNGTLYPERTISWQAREGTAIPSDVLQSTSGTFKCSAGQRICLSHLLLKDDNISRNTSWLKIELILNLQDAKSSIIDDARKYCNVTLMENDFPNGRVEFSLDSRNVFMPQMEVECQLSLERSGFLNKVVSVVYSTFSLSGPSVVAGVDVPPAISGIHYSKMTGNITFSSGMNIQKLSIPLKTSSMYTLELPVRFSVLLTAASFGLVLGETLSNITISSNAEYPVWNVWSQVTLAKSNDSLLRMLSNLNVLVQSSNFSRTMVTVTNQILQYVSSSFNGFSLSDGIRTTVMEIFCSANQMDRQDSFLGYLPLTETLGLFASSLLQPISTCNNEVKSSEISSCHLVIFLIKQSRAKDIKNLKWDQFGTESLTMTVQTASDYSSSDQCVKVLFVIYKSLTLLRRGDAKEYLNNMFLYFNAYPDNKLEPVRLARNILYSFKTDTIPSQLNRCVFCDANKPKCPDDSSGGMCQLENNLLLGTSRSVDCSCAISWGSFGVVTEANGLLYPIWFHLSCIYVVVSCAVSLIVHLFTANTYGPVIKMSMQMILSILAFQLVYVIDVFLSPWNLLKPPSYNCIITSIVLHFFYVSQFSWIICQVYNLYIILHHNKDAKSISFMKNFVASWGSSLIFICAFCLCAFFIFTYATSTTFDEFYGDVTGNKDVCFMTNLYAGLIGIFLMQLATLLAVMFFLHKTSRVWDQWKDYDDIYVGNRNGPEYALLVILWMFLISSYFFGGLHLITRQEWILIIFVVTNISMGIYISISYGLIRCFGELQSKLRRQQSQNSSKFISIRNAKKKDSGNLELVSSANDFTDEPNRVDSRYAEDVVGYNGDDIEEPECPPGAYPESKFQSPATTFKLANINTASMIRLQRAHSDDSIKVISIDGSLTHFTNSNHSEKINFLNDRQIDDLLSICGKNFSDFESTKSPSLGDPNEPQKSKDDVMSDIFV